MGEGVFNLTASGDSEFSGAGAFGVPRKKLPPNVVPGGAPTPLSAPIIRPDPDAVAGTSLIVDALAMWSNSPTAKSWQWSLGNVAQGNRLTSPPTRLDGVAQGDWKLIEYAENAVNAGNPNYSNSNVVSIAAVDTAPNAFIFDDVSNAEPTTEYTSNQVTITGLNRPAAFTPPAGVSYQKNTDAYSTVATTFVEGDKLRVRRTTGSAFSTTQDAVITIGGVSDTWSITTKAAPVVTKPVGYDDFNRPDNTSISADGSGKWVSVSGSASGLRITNQMAATTTNEGGHRFYLDVTANHYAQAIMKSTGSVGAFVGVRYTDQNNMVGVRWNSASLQLWKRIGSTLTQIGSFSMSTLDKLLRLEHNNDLVRVLVDGVEIIAPVNVADVPASTFTGATSRTVAAVPWIENWEAGAL